MENGIGAVFGHCASRQSQLFAELTIRPANYPFGSHNIRFAKILSIIGVASPLYMESRPAGRGIHVRFSTKLFFFGPVSSGPGLFGGLVGWALLVWGGCCWTRARSCTRSCAFSSALHVEAIIYQPYQCNFLLGQFQDPGTHAFP